MLADSDYLAREVASAASLGDLGPDYVRSELRETLVAIMTRLDNSKPIGAISIPTL